MREKVWIGVGRKQVAVPGCWGAHRLAEVLEISAAEVPVGSGFEAHGRRLVEGIGEEVGGVDLLDRDAVGHHVCTDDSN